jgi:hypothetical protein
LKKSFQRDLLYQKVWRAAFEALNSDAGMALNRQQSEPWDQPR